MYMDAEMVKRDNSVMINDIIVKHIVQNKETIRIFICK